jgi:hypothetical protein
MPWVKSGWVKPGYIKTLVTPTTGVAFPVPPPGQWPVATPDPARLTLTASPPTTDFPRGPYGVVTALVLQTHAGTRIFSAVSVDPIYTVPPSVGRYVTLIDLDPITLSQGSAGATLVTRINSLERASFGFTVDNSDGFWSSLVANEYLLCQTVSLYLDYGDGVHRFCGRGQVAEIEIRRKTTRMTVEA